MIKKYIFIFMIFFSSNLSSYAQDYIPIIQEGSFWEVTELGPGTCTYINRYRVGDDFNYNSKVYKNIEVAPVRGEDDPNDLCHPTGDMYVNENEFTPSSSYLREDINEKKLYILVHIDNQYYEYTVADFTLEVGDVMTNSYAESYTNPGTIAADLSVVQIDISSDGRKRYILEDGRELFVEGIGNYQGPIYMYRPYMLYDNTFSVSCSGNDSTDNSDCAPVLSVDNYRLAQIKVFPNPTLEKISFTNLDNNTFKLYSIIGKEIFIQFSEQNQEIDISHLNQGIYFLEIRGSKNSKRIIKLVKN